MNQWGIFMALPMLAGSNPSSLPARKAEQPPMSPVNAARRGVAGNQADKRPFGIGARLLQRGPAALVVAGGIGHDRKSRRNGAYSVPSGVSMATVVLIQYPE